MLICLNKPKNFIKQCKNCRHAQCHVHVHALDPPYNFSILDQNDCVSQLYQFYISVFSYYLYFAKKKLHSKKLKICKYNMYHYMYLNYCLQGDCFINYFACQSFDVTD